jgi:hypothetical protein
MCVAWDVTFSYVTERDRRPFIAPFQVIDGLRLERENPARLFHARPGAHLAEKVTRILTILLFTVVGIAAYWSGDFLYTFKPRVGGLMAQFYEDEARLRPPTESGLSPEKSEALQKRASATQDEIQRLMTLRPIALITFALSLAAYVVLIYFLVLREPREEIDISRFG